MFNWNNAWPGLFTIYDLDDAQCNINLLNCTPYVYMTKKYTAYIYIQNKHECGIWVLMHSPIKPK